MCKKWSQRRLGAVIFLITMGRLCGRTTFRNPTRAQFPAGRPGASGNGFADDLRRARVFNDIADALWCPQRSTFSNAGRSRTRGGLGGSSACDHFLHVSLTYPDYRGNLQYISTGNLAADHRACLFLMDYPHRARLKVYAHVETLALDDDPDLTRLATVPGYRAKLERVFRLRLETFDWNCQQHIIPRFTEQEVVEAIRPLRDRLAQLESENAELRARLANNGGP
jgi:hypothetical protein